MSKNFVEFRNAVMDKFYELSDVCGNAIFEMEVGDKSKLWDAYINNFPEGTNPIFRTNRVHDCTCCRHFIKAVGALVGIKNGDLISIWDVNLPDDSEFKKPARALSDFVKSQVKIKDIFCTKFDNYGMTHNYKEIDGESVKFDHFYLEVPEMYKSNDCDTFRGDFRSSVAVFKRGLDEFTLQALDDVLDLINDNNLYRGEQYLRALKSFRAYKLLYDNIEDNRSKEFFAWEKATHEASSIVRLRNTSIGTLLTNISTGMDVETAVRKYEVIVAPSNYKRPKAIFTQKMLDEAKETITELGYMDSIGRKFATIDDMNVNNVLFIDRNTKSKLDTTEDIFAQMSKECVVKRKSFDRAQEISIEDFINLVPQAKSIEALFTSDLERNLVSLIAPKVKDSKSMFKWNNNFSWAYKGNIADSAIKENVKNAGGNVSGVLRFSIQWNDIDRDMNDLDAHCLEPNRFHINFSAKKSPYTNGALDIDIINPSPNEPAVENIIYPDKESMIEGRYIFFVHNFTFRGGRSGFRAEIECDGELYQFDYRKPLQEKEVVEVAAVTFDKEKGFTVETLLPADVINREVWGLKTNTFVPVRAICLSPNYWDDNQVGAKHYMFMLQDCVNEDQPNGFFNEYLKDELMKHKRVFEALGHNAKVDDCPNQLSGLGFSASRRNEVIVKIDGKKVYKVKF